MNAGLLRLRIQIDVDQYGAIVVTIEHGYFFEYRVKATLIYITYVETFEHPMSSNLTRLCITKEINKKIT